jgi:hypothetical protein
MPIVEQRRFSVAPRFELHGTRRAMQVLAEHLAQSSPGNDKVITIAGENEPFGSRNFTFI